MAAITVTDLTSGDVAGTGVFDQLMRATKAHLAEEYSKSRIKGSEYATVYLGAMQSVMSQSLQYLLQEQRTDLEAQLLQEQIESENLNQLNIPKQGKLLDAQTAQTEASAALETRRMDLVAEEILVAKQNVLVSMEEVKIAQAKLVNIPKEGAVLDGQKCKLDAEFDLLTEQRMKTVSETALLNQKKVTEQAQTSHVNVDPESVVGRQNTLYKNQADGYLRDAEQKAAKLMADSFNVIQTTSGGLVGGDYGFSEEAVASVINKLRTSINA